VESILGGAARILGKVASTADGFGLSGPPVLSTNRVAEVAGVSIGSLYQYFPGKQAIAAAVVRKSFQWTFEPLLEELEHGGDLPLEALVSRFVDRAIDIKLSNFAVETGLVAETVRQGLTGEALNLDAEYVARFAAALEKLKPTVRTDLPAEVSAYLLFNALRAPMILGSLQRPDLLRSTAFAGEMKALLVRYLRPG
jgi:AcrR family transcriptional regulator